MTPQRVREIAVALTTPEGMELVAAYKHLRESARHAIACAHHQVPRGDHNERCTLCSDCEVRLQMHLDCTERTASIARRP